MEHICKHKHLGEDEVRKYVRQITLAIQHLHLAGIVHRYVNRQYSGTALNSWLLYSSDLKVENLLLDENMDIKIIGTEPVVAILPCILSLANVHDKMRPARFLLLAQVESTSCMKAFCMKAFLRHTSEYVIAAHRPCKNRVGWKPLKTMRYFNLFHRSPHRFRLEQHVRYADPDQWTDNADRSLSHSVWITSVCRT